MQVIEGTPNDKIAAINADVTRVQGEIQSIDVNDEESKVIASEMLSGIKIRFKRIEELRIFFVKPLNDQVKNINDMFRTPKEALEAAEKILKKKLIAYEDEQERIRKAKEEAEAKAKAEAEAKAKAEAEATAKAAEEAAAKAAQAKSAEEKAEAEAEAKKAEQAAQEAEVAAKVELDKKIATIETPKTTQTALGSTTTKKVWTFEITDPSKVPAEYLIVDEKKIRAAVKEGAREIAGVRIFQETQIAAR